MVTQPVTHLLTLPHVLPQVLVYGLDQLVILEQTVDVTMSRR